MPEAPFTTVIRRAQNVSATALALSGVTQLELQLNKCNFAWITCAVAGIRYAWDGSSPTGSVGHVLPVATPLQITGRQRILAFRFIGDAGAASIVTFTLDNTANAGGVV